MSFYLLPFGIVISGIGITVLRFSKSARLVGALLTCGGLVMIFLMLSHLGSNRKSVRDKLFQLKPAQVKNITITTINQNVDNPPTPLVLRDSATIEKLCAGIKTMPSAPSGFLKTAPLLNEISVNLLDGDQLFFRQRSEDGKSVFYLESPGKYIEQYGTFDGSSFGKQLLLLTSKH